MESAQEAQEWLDVKPVDMLTAIVLIVEMCIVLYVSLMDIRVEEVAVIAQIVETTMDLSFAVIVHMIAMITMVVEHMIVVVIIVAEEAVLMIAE